jgi:curved DNA-binding protein CbpA
MAKFTIAECFQTLELPHGATLIQCREAYKKLVRVWHPDRFASSPGLKADAEEKLKRLNAAIEILQAHFSVSAEDAVDASGQANVDSSYRESVFYRGSDPRIRDVTMAERVHGGRVAFVELSEAGIGLVTLERDQPQDVITYPSNEIGVVQSAGAKRILFYANDPEGISRLPLEVELEFRNEYTAKRFLKRAREFGVFKPRNSSAPVSQPIVNPESDAADAKADFIAGVACLVVVLFGLAVAIASIF